MSRASTTTPRRARVCIHTTCAHINPFIRRRRQRYRRRRHRHRRRPSARRVRRAVSVDTLCIEYTHTHINVQSIPPESRVDGPLANHRRAQFACDSSPRLLSTACVRVPCVRACIFAPFARPCFARPPRRVLHIRSAAHHAWCTHSRVWGPDGCCCCCCFYRYGLCLKRERV